MVAAPPASTATSRRSSSPALVVTRMVIVPGSNGTSLPQSPCGISLPATVSFVPADAPLTVTFTSPIFARTSPSSLRAASAVFLYFSTLAAAASASTATAWNLS